MKHKNTSAYADVLAEIKEAQSLDPNIYYRYFTRHISALITALLVNTRATPTIVTATMFVFGITGGIFFSIGEELYYILGGVFFLFLNIADTVDGELARYKKISSNFGDYLDRLAHYVTNSSMILGLGIGLYSNYESMLILYATVIVLLFYLFDDLVRDLVISCGLGDSKNRKKEKQNMSIVGQSNIKKFVSYTAGNSGFWHLIVLVSIFDLVISAFFPVIESLVIINTYIAYFAFFSVVKAILRIPLVMSLKDK